MPKVISKDKEEEMSSALIAQLLAEDALSQGNSDYYAEYSNDNQHYENMDDSYEDNSEDDFDPKKKGRVSSKKEVKKGRKRKAPPVNEEPVEKKPTEKDSEEKEPKDGKKEEEKQLSKKPRRPVPEGFNTGVYTPLEEKNFVEGLELFGRDWIKLQAHVATRDPNSIRSHAQKHFIKMYRDSVPLPEKVLLTGKGYTLSGKPLDPSSAAAKPYLKSTTHVLDQEDPKEDNSEKKKKDQQPKDEKPKDEKPKDEKPKDEKPKDEKPKDEKPKDEKPKDEKPKNEQPKDEQPKDEQPKNEQPKDEQPKDEQPKDEQPKDEQPKDEQPKDEQKNNENPENEILNDEQQKDIKIQEKKTKNIVKKLKKTPKEKPKTAKDFSVGSSYDTTGRTSYSSSRLRKQIESINYGQITKDEDPLTMIKCEPFLGKPGSNSAGSQPFEMKVNSNVLLAMDFHSHLMTTEIIGFLAGEWDKEKMHIVIREAYPCRSIETGSNEVNVEMDPTSAIETRQLIEERNLKVVGWYHSHPTFIPDPSLIDIENQRNYQILCRDGHGSTEPFVGAIVGPYDPNLPGSASVINWFHVSNTNSERPIPKRLVYELEENEHVTDQESDRMFELLNVYKSSPEKSKLNELWRQDATETKLEKMIKSLATRMPGVQKKLKESNGFTDAFLEKVQQELKSW